MYDADDFLDSILNEPDELDAEIESLLEATSSSSFDIGRQGIPTGHDNDDDDNLKKILDALRDSDVNAADAADGDDDDDADLMALIKPPSAATMQTPPPQQQRQQQRPKRSASTASTSTSATSKLTSTSSFHGPSTEDEGTNDDDDDDQVDYHDMMTTHSMNDDFDSHFGDLLSSPMASVAAHVNTQDKSLFENMSKTELDMAIASAFDNGDSSDDGAHAESGNPHDEDEERDTDAVVPETASTISSRSSIASTSPTSSPSTSSHRSPQKSKDPAIDVFAAAKTRNHRTSSTSRKAEQVLKSIMRVDSMGNLSHYISNPATVQQMGRPRAIVTAPSLTAIGTSHGLILLFVSNEDKVTVLKIVDSSKSGSEVNVVNSVVCMDITSSGDCIVAGYERGQIVVWDINTRSAVKKITDCFTTPVDFLYFLHDRNKFIASSKGLVKTVSVSKVLFSHFSDIKTVVDRSFGPVRHLQVLPQAQAQHETNEYLIIAIATDQEVMVLTLQPLLKVIARMARPEGIDHNAMPYLAWRRVLSSLRADDAEFEQSNEKDQFQSAPRLKGKNPMLAIGWGSVLNFFQLQKLESLELFKIQTLTLKTRFGDVLGMSWLDERIIAVLVSKGHVCLFDPFSNHALLEHQPVLHIEPVSHSRFRIVDMATKKSSAVSVYHQSYCTLSGRLYLLGEKGVLCVQALTWKQRIDALFDIGRFDDALNLGVQFFKGGAVAAVGLPTETSLRQRIVGKKLTKHLLKHFHETVRGFAESNHLVANPQVLAREYEMFGRKCMDICLQIGHSDLIFHDIYQVFKSENQEQVFFDLVEEFIIGKRLNHVPVEFINVMLQAYSSTRDKSAEEIAENLHKLENIILNLYIPRNIGHYDSSTSPDTSDSGNGIDDMGIEFVTILMEHCTHHKMYKALIYLYNTAKDDYITPITILTDVIQKREVERIDAIVTMLFDYLEQCFHGEAFPSKERNALNIPHDRLFVIKQELLNFIFTPTGKAIKSTVPKHAAEAQRYQRLCKFAHLNTRRLFEILLYIILDDTPTSPWNERNRKVLFPEQGEKQKEYDPTKPPATDKRETSRTLQRMSSTGNISRSLPTQKPSHTPPTDRDAVPKKVISRQEMFDILRNISVDTSLDIFSPWEIDQSGTWPTLEDIDLIFRFFLVIIKQDVVIIDSNTMQRAIATLSWNASTMYDEQEKRDVQNDIVTVLKKKHSLELDFQKVNSICEKAGFYKIIAELRMRSKHYDKVLEAYLMDEELQVKVFDFINDLLSTVSERSSTFSEIKLSTMNHLSELLRLNSDQTAQLVIRHFSSEYKSVISKLKPFPQLQYEYLKNIIHNDSSEMASLLRNKNIELDEGMHFQYFALMCQFDRDNVYHYLRSQQHYRIDECLKVCQKYNITDATSYLLERAGDIPGAINLYQKSLCECQNALAERLAREAKVIDVHNDRYLSLDSFHFTNRDVRYVLFPKSATSSRISEHIDNRQKYEASLPRIPERDGRLSSVQEIQEYLQMFDNLRITIDMCQRNTDNNNLDPDEAKAIWFGVLDTFVQPQRELRLGYQGKLVVVVPRPQIGKGREDSVVYVNEATAMASQESVVNEMSKLRDRKDEMEKQMKYEYREDKMEEMRKQLAHCNDRLKDLTEEKSQWKQAMTVISKEKERRKRDPLAPNNLPKLANLWLQLCYATCIRTIFELMIGYISLADIVSTIATRYQTHELGHFKESLIDLYDKYDYETVLYRSMDHLTHSDSFALHREFIHNHARGVKPIAANCFLCNTTLFDLQAATTTAENSENTGLCMFHCGHGYHTRCLHSAGVSKCPTCNPVELNRAMRSRSLAPGQDHHDIGNKDRADALSTMSRRLRAVDMKLSNNGRFGQKLRTAFNAAVFGDDDGDDDDGSDDEVRARRLRMLRGGDRSQLTSRRHIDTSTLESIRTIGLVSSFDELLEN